MSNFIDQLNEIQRQAVTQTEGPVLVIAGAGSGKTRVLTYRIAYLLNQRIPGYQIMALTFTNKAAREMKERISKTLPESAINSLWMGTFHSVFARILRREHEAIGFPASFTIYDTEDARNLIKSIIHDLKLDDQLYPAMDIMRRISSAKNQLITAQSYKSTREFTAQDESSRRPETARIYELYSQKCRQASAMDFDDLLLVTWQMFRQNPEVLQKYQNQFRYLLIDEYQDTNYAQYQIIKQLADKWKNVCVVGDDSQSIYSFRGARIENILNFRNDYPDYQVFKLEQNYRSTKVIVEAANSLIANNQGRIPKEVWSDNEQGELIELIEAETDQEEGFLITSRILETRYRTQTDYNGFAILYRTHAQSRVIEESCRKQNIPYKVFGSISFYQRKEIKDILAYFRLIINPKDDESLKRIINFPARGIGKTTLDRLTQAAFAHSLPIWDILSNPTTWIPELNRGTSDKLQNFVAMIHRMIEMAGSLSAGEFAIKVLQETGILELYRYDRTPEGISKFENIQELINGIKEYTENNNDMEDADTSIAGFIQNVALLTDQDNDKEGDGNKVSLMTIHSAKGLEFKYVFIAGLEEELFPSSFSSYSARELEEERRLFYVAITRAMNRATISFAKTRYRWGSLVYCSPSRFIREIDPKYIQHPKARRSDRQAATETEPPVTKPTAVPRRLIPVPGSSGRVATNEHENFEADDPQLIQTGMEVEHPVFGRGKVMQLEGDMPNRKATIFFRNSGQKQLLLRFARLKVVKS